MGAHRHAKLVLLGLGFIALSACNPAPIVPDVVPDPAPATTGATPTPEPSAKSRKLARYYGRLQSNQLTQGLLRTDGGGIDTPYSDKDLLRNFEQIVFFDEYVEGGGFRRSDGTSGALRKWQDPVRVMVEFGASVPKDQRAADMATIDHYTARLARISGHSITSNSLNPNFHVLIMGEDDRAQAVARIRQIVPGITPKSLEVFSSLPRSIQCLVVAFHTPDSGFSYLRAVAFIRAEHPALLRRACIHEEIAQGFGLANDSPRARPSIFNDDDEFALLTSHDEELLRLLYNPALRPGMTVDQARPILRRLIAVRPGRTGSTGPT